MSSCCLVTGGAGFIGCAAAPSLLKAFGRVVVVDNLHPQIHPSGRRPAALDAHVELVVADVCDPLSWDRVLNACQPSAVLHLAAETGTGQSLTEASRHASVNVVGLTRLLDALSARGIRLEQAVLTSSRAVYGEGAWQRATGEVFYPGQRDLRTLEAGQWDFEGAAALPFVAGRTEPHPTSVYGATKLAQEHILGAWGQAFGIPVSLLRLQNVYGPGQSLTNPYTGIVPLFARVARKGESIPVYEDGQMLRDFVSVRDVTRAISLAFEKPPQKMRILDIGSGDSTSILNLANHIARLYDAPTPHVSGAFRNGDVRHASCRIEAARNELGYEPSVALAEGLQELCRSIDLALGQS